MNEAIQSIDRALEITEEMLRIVDDKLKQLKEKHEDEDEST